MKEQESLLQQSKVTFIDPNLRGPIKHGVTRQSRCLVIISHTTPYFNQQAFAAMAHAATNHTLGFQQVDFLMPDGIHGYNLKACNIDKDLEVLWKKAVELGDEWLNEVNSSISGLIDIKSSPEQLHSEKLDGHCLLRWACFYNAEGVLSPEISAIKRQLKTSYQLGEANTSDTLPHDIAIYQGFKQTADEFYVRHQRDGVETDFHWILEYVLEEYAAIAYLGLKNNYRFIAYPREEEPPALKAMKFGFYDLAVKKDVLRWLFIKMKVPAAMHKLVLTQYTQAQALTINGSEKQKTIESLLPDIPQLMQSLHNQSRINSFLEELTRLKKRVSYS